MVLFLHITTRIEGRKDDDLLKVVGGTGFPHLAAMDAEGKVMGSPPGRKVRQFRDFMTVVKEYLDLKPKAAKGDPNARVEFFIRAIQLGEYKDLQSAEKHYQTLSKVSKEQKEKIERLLVDLEVSDVLKPLRENRDRTKSQELQAEAGKTFAAMHRKGRVPVIDRTFGDFYSCILTFAQEEKDIPLFEEALKNLEERFPEATGFLNAKRKILDDMKSGK